MHYYNDENLEDRIGSRDENVFVLGNGYCDHTVSIILKFVYCTGPGGIYFNPNIRVP